MKKLFSQILMLLPVILMVSCSDKFNVAAPYKDITVIYGLLDQADTAHYIRIQKAYLDENKSAVLMAQTADSNFFTHLNVMIKRLDFSSYLVDTIHLNRVDLNLEGYPKQAGAFFNAPNYAYKFKNFLDPNYIYRLIVTNLSTGVVDSAETPIIDENPATFYVIKFDTSVRNVNLDFNSTINGRVLDIAGSYTPPANFSFEGQTTPIGITQLVIRYNWLDSNGSTFINTPKYCDINEGYGVMTQNSFDFKIGDLSLYNALANGMQCAPFNTYRLLSRCQLYIYFGTTDFSIYEQRISSQGTGLTGDEIEPSYTNIRGTNVLGLFTSRGVRSGYVTISDATFDSLRNSTIINPCSKMYWKAYH